MKRAILVSTSTVLGVAAALSYQPGSQTAQALMDLTGASQPAAQTDPVAAPEATATEPAAAPTTAEPSTAAAPSAAASASPAAAKPKATTKPKATAKPKPQTAATTAPAPAATAAAPAPAPAPTKAASTGPRTLTGNSFPAAHGREFYGDVVATVTLEGGKMTNLSFTETPSGRNERYITAVRQYLLPAILQAQNVNVGYVSGATATSEAFVKSLQSALAKA